MSFIKGSKLSRRKNTGGRTTCYFKIKKVHSMPGKIHLVRVSPDHKVKKSRMRGGKLKLKCLYVQKANMYDPISKTHSLEIIRSVTENPANRNYVQRNIINRDSVIDTSKGLARVTSRPGQHGVINCIKIVEK